MTEKRTMIDREVIDESNISNLKYNGNNKIDSTIPIIVKIND